MLEQGGSTVASQSVDSITCSIDAVHVCPVVELQPATVSMGTVTATLATLVPTQQIAPATRATLVTTVRWMTVSVKQSQHYCYALYHVFIHVATQEILYIHTYIYQLLLCVLSMLGVYANFTCPTNSRCEGGHCRCNPGWTGEDCDMRELSYTYTDAALLGVVQECTHHSHLSVVPFCNAVASNPCGYYNLTCHNNGSCISMYTANGTYTYSCMCRPSFTGHDCSQQLPSESMIAGIILMII